MTEAHTLARAGYIYKDNDLKNNAAHLDYMKLIKQAGNSRKSIHGVESLATTNSKIKNADLTEINGNWQNSNHKLPSSNQTSKQPFLRSGSNSNTTKF